MTKLIRVEMESDDGKVTRLTGDEAERWLRACNSCIGMSTVHGVEMVAFEWEVVKQANDAPPDLAPASEARVLKRCPTCGYVIRPDGLSGDDDPWCVCNEKPPTPEPERFWRVFDVLHEGKQLWCWYPVLADGWSIRVKPGEVVHMTGDEATFATRDEAVRDGEASGLEPWKGEVGK